MTVQKAISGVYIQSVQIEAGNLTIAGEHDPLLRRFGQCDFVRNAGTVEFYRQQADEVWGICSGEAELELLDQRKDSPTHGQQMTISMDADEPRTVLIPFGVYTRVEGWAEFVRLTTHAEVDSMAGDFFRPIP